MSAKRPNRKKRPALPRRSPAPFGGADRSGTWQMSGSGDPQLWEDFGLTEGEVGMMAIEAIYYAVDRAEGNPERFVAELESEFSVALQERLGVDLCPEVPAIG